MSEGVTEKASPLRDALVVVALVVCTNGPVMYLAWRVLQGAPHWEDPAVRGIFAAMAAVSVLAVLLDSQRVSGRRLRLPSVLAGASVVTFTAVIVASSLWSLDPAVTRARSVIYIGLAALAWIIADLDWTRFRRLLLVTLASVLLGSLVTVVLSDSIGLDHNGDWRGLFLNPNELAPLAALALLVGLPALLKTRNRGRILPALLLVMGALLLVGSGSLTAWVALFGAVTIASLVWFASVGRARFGPRAIWGAVAAALLGGVAAAGVLAARSGPTLASRRAIWDFVWERIAERPLVGHGWFSVWDRPEFLSSDELSGASSAHNSFLEVWLGAGLLALLPFVVIVATALWGSAQALWRDPSKDSWTWFALVVFLVIVNLTLSFVLWFSYIWVLLMSAALRSAGPLRSAKPARDTSGVAHPLDA